MADSLTHPWIFSIVAQTRFALDLFFSTTLFRASKVSIYRLTDLPFIARFLPTPGNLVRRGCCTLAAPERVGWQWKTKQHRTDGCRRRWHRVPTTSQYLSGISSMSHQPPISTSITTGRMEDRFASHRVLYRTKTFISCTEHHR